MWEKGNHEQGRGKIHHFVMKSALSGRECSWWDTAVPFAPCNSAKATRPCHHPAPHCQTGITRPFTHLHRSAQTLQYTSKACKWLEKVLKESSKGAIYNREFPYFGKKIKWLDPFQTHSSKTWSFLLVKNFCCTFSPVCLALVNEVSAPSPGRK